MDMKIKETFTEKWKRYFPGSELPIACFYSDELNGVEYPDAPKTNKRFVCVFGQLTPVRMGKARAFNPRNIGCYGAVGMFGFSDTQAQEMMENSYDFLINEEKFYKTEEQIKGIFAEFPPVPAPGKYIVFKRWDLLTEEDEPLVLSFFCRPDAISGLHALANYDSMTPHAVIAPFSSGCDSLIGFAMRELQTDAPRAVLGLFDPSSRVCVKPDLLTFSIPWPKFTGMLENMDRCFLTTDLWQAVCKRMVASENI